MSIITSESAWSAEDLIYMAAIMDGEGCFSIGKQTTARGYYAQIIVTNTDYRLMEFLAATFGGYVSQSAAQTDRHKQTWQWAMRRRKDLGVVIASMRPYLKLKGAQADILLEFVSGQSSVKVRRLSDEEVARGARLYGLMRVLNRRGVAAGVAA